MNDNDIRAWYSSAPEAWYAPAQTEEAKYTYRAPKKPRRKHTGMKVTMIVICVLVLIAGSVYIFSDGESANDSLSSLMPSKDDDDIRGEITPNEDSKDSEDSKDNGNFNFGFDFGFGDDFSSSLPENDSEMPDNFRDFFDSYYTTTEEIEPSNIPAAPTAQGISLELESSAGKSEMSLQELYDECLPSIVGVMAYTDGSMGYGWGTGVIMNADGYIITNAHVISGADSCSVVLFNGKECSALLVGEDTQSDIAVLKIEAKGLKAASFGNSDELDVGDRVVAIGNPLGDQFSGTMTDGIISAIDRSMDYAGTKMTLLQTNAALNEGNSGGPLINMYGQVIGITNMKMSASYSEVSIEGIGFAIPTVTVKEIADSIISNGEVRGRPGIGIVCGSVPEAAMEEYGLPEGLYITEVTKGTDAWSEGIRAGDVLTHVNGTKVLTTDDVLNIRDEFNVGDELLMRIYREGEYFEVYVELYDLNDIG